MYSQTYSPAKSYAFSGMNNKKDNSAQPMLNSHWYNCDIYSAGEAAFALREDKVIECNDRALELLGKNNVKEIEGKSLAELSPLKQLDGYHSDEKTQKIIDKVRNCGYYGLKWQFAGAKDKLIYTKLQLNKSKINGNLFSIAIAKEITINDCEEQSAINNYENTDTDFASLFMMNLSHEVRTPLNAVVGFAQLMQKKEFDRDKQKEYLSIIQNNGQNLLQLIDNLVLLANIEKGRNSNDKSTCYIADLKEIAEGLVRDYQKHYKKEHLDIIIDLNEQIDSGISIDLAYTRKVLAEIIKNAMVFTGSGSIYVGCKNINNRYLLFFIKDSGIGIAADDQQLVFEKFYKSNDGYTNEHRGLGIGLTIAKRLVHKLGGDIWLTSKESEGSVFYFTVPVEVE